MITLTDVKTYLNITKSDFDAGLIKTMEMAKSRLNSLTGRKLDYQLITETFKGNGKSEMFFKEFPIVLSDILTIKYYDSTTNDYVNLLSGTDTIADTVEVLDGFKIVLRKGYVFTADADFKVTYYAGYKSTKTSKTITAISQDLVNTNLIKINIGSHSYTAGEVFYIDGITDFQNNPNGCQKIYSVNSPFIYVEFDLGTGSYTSGGTAEFDINLENTTPADLKQAALYLCQKYWYDSPQGGNSRAGIDSLNIGGQSSEGVKYKDIEVEAERIANKYRIINV